MALATGTGSAGSVNNVGNIYAATVQEYYTTAEGIVVSADGDAGIRNSGDIIIGYGDYAYGALALAFAGDADVNNTGYIGVNGGFRGYGVVAASQNGYTDVRNGGSIVTGGNTAAGIDASSLAGTTVTNTGDIEATAGKYAFGVLANSSQGDTVVDNRGTISTDGKYSFGVMAQSGDGNVSIYNSGKSAGSGKYAYGAVAGSNYGDAAILNAEDGALSGYSGDLLAVGAFANANNDGNASIDNAGVIGATGAGYAQVAYGAVVQTDAGDGLVTNSGDIGADNSYGAARSVIVRSSAGGDVEVDNSGNISAISTGSGVYEGYYGTYTVNTDVIGIYAYAPGATATVDNSGTIAVSTAAGLADGVFAAGAIANVTNSGSITADGYTWGAGIEAQGDDAATVVNTGTIAASATAYAPADEEAGTDAVYGHAYGVYAAGGDGGVMVDNQGSIAATGPYATGVFAYDGGAGGVVAGNSGDITATADNGFATGISAATNVEYSDIAIQNAEGGSITATGMNGASGIVATATGTGSSGSVNNAGNIYAATTVYYSTAEGIVVSADGAADIDNVGTITIGYGDYAYGALALAFAGDAGVQNTGSVVVNGGFEADGFVVASQNGYANAVNGSDGSITVDSRFGDGIGIDASSLSGTTVQNEGDITAAANKYAIGVLGNTSAGDTMVANSGTIATDGKYSFGVLAQSGDGNAAIYNTGTISGAGKYAYGAVAGSAYGDAMIANAEGGTISGYSGDLIAVGAFANANNAGYATIANEGSIDATGAGYAQIAYGAVVQTDAGTGLVSNGDTGQISASNGYGSARAVIVRSSAGGTAAADNAGNVMATATGTGEAIASDAIGMYVYAPGAAAIASNSGSVTASSASGLADGVFASGATVDVSNTGTITADGFTWGAGIEAQGDDAASVRNAGSIAATGIANVPADDEAGTPGVYGHAYGIYAAGGQGGVDVRATAASDITALGTFVTGIHAYNGYGGAVSVVNAGDISVADRLAEGTPYYGYAAGIRVLGAAEGTTATVRNSGNIDATAEFGASGIEITLGSDDAQATAVNSGTINAYTVGKYIANGVSVSSGGDATVNNSGAIDVLGKYSYGAQAMTAVGAARATNSGDIAVLAGGLYAMAYGVQAWSSAGDARATNTGAVSVDGGTAKGVSASGATATAINRGSVEVGANSKYGAGTSAIATAGDARADNSNSLNILGGKYGSGIEAISAEGAVRATNSGDIAVVSDYAYGIKAVSSLGDVNVSNSGAGSIDTTGATTAGFGAAGWSQSGNVSMTNQGSIAGGGTYASYGLFGRADAGNVAITNRGDIASASSVGSGVGIHAQAAGGNVTITNAVGATIAAEGVDAAGINAVGPDGRVRVTNAGSITAAADGGSAVGVFAGGDVVSVTNSGDITATTTGTDIYDATGVHIDATTSATFRNTGTITTATAEGSGVAVHIDSDGSLNFSNTGTLVGAVVTHAGDDHVTGEAGSTWSLVNQSTDLGAGNDRISNLAGSVISLVDGRIDMGSGINRFRNHGVITVDGDNVIELGKLSDAEIQALAEQARQEWMAQQAARPDRSGAAVAAPSRIPVDTAFDPATLTQEDLNALAGKMGISVDRLQAALDNRGLPEGHNQALFNDGTIDLATAARGGASNRLAIDGDLAGRGSILVDGNASQRVDLLQISGDVREGTRQVVDVSFRGLPQVGGTEKVFARVDGSSRGDAFQAGEVIGADPSNFMALAVGVKGNVDASNATADEYLATVEASGLNDTGSLAASIGAGVQNMLATQIGSFRQRTGAMPAATTDRRFAGYVRSFRNEGTSSPNHVAQNFGQGGNFDFHQISGGTEVGMSFAPAAGFSVGLMAGKSEGQQSLTGAGAGMQALQANTYGLFGTWMSPKGLYVDTSYWSMNFDARLLADGGGQSVNGSANALNVESGYTFRLANGVSVEPQLQYTWTRVDGLRVFGADADFQSADNDWKRTRLGLSVWKSFARSSGLRWTPYGSISAVHMAGGNGDYTIDDAFLGSMNVQGTSALLEGGIGLQKGGFSANAGLNWTSGAETDSFLGGQVVLRYGW